MGYVKKAVFSLILVFALFALLAILTQAHQTLLQADIGFFALASVFYLLGVLAWVISWAYLIKKKADIPYSKVAVVGFSAVFGALTPIQLGAEALRSIKLKQHFNVSYADSVSASMVVKGVKFLLLSALAAMVLSFYLVQSLAAFSPLLFLGFASGFFVVVLAAALFLLPLHKKTGLKIAGFFGLLSRKIAIFQKLESFFQSYAGYLSEVKASAFAVIFLLSLLTLALEFLALHYSFAALNIALPAAAVLALLILVSVLERTPFLPRGLGLVELVGFNFLAFPSLLGKTVLSASAIGAVLIVYDLVRLVVPTVLSLLFNMVFRKV